jgi:nuclear transcription Y subunit beta
LAKTHSELFIDWWLETLLANQNKPAGANQFNAAGSAAGGNPGPEGAQHPNVLTSDTDMADNDNTAFGYPVHNGNGAAEF